MFEQLREMIEKMENEANEIVPMEVVLKMDKDGNGMIKCEGRNKEIFMMLGDLLSQISQFDERRLEMAFAEIRIACKASFEMHKQENGDE